MNIICCSLPNLGNGVKQVDVPCPAVQNPRSLKGPGVRFRFVSNGLKLRGFSVCRGNSGAKFNLSTVPDSPRGGNQTSLPGIWKISLTEAKGVICEREGYSEVV